MRPVLALSCTVFVTASIACVAPASAPSPSVATAGKPVVAPVSSAASSDRPAVKAFRATESLPQDPDDPAIWINKQNPASSVILGTMKVAAPDGGLAVFGLDGKLRQFLKGANRPNNVDVEYGLELDATPTDIAVLTERLGRRLRVYAIPPTGGPLRDISAGTLPILAGAPDDEGAPMGIGLYRRPRDGAIFAIVAPKAGPKNGYLWQYRLQDDGSGRVGARFVRRFGSFSGSGEIEAIGVDDELGYVYYADEVTGIHKWHADPEAPGAAQELALFATSGYQQDREGLGIYARSGGTGFLVSVDQLPGQSVFHLYRREGEAGHPHDHSAVVLSFTGGADRY